ncbi:MAG: type IV secretion system protein [Pseudomonadota bacterium]
MADNKEGSADLAKAWVMLSIVIVALMLFLWSIFQYEIKDIFRMIRYAWMWPLSFILPADYTVSWNGQAMRFADWFRVIPDIPAASIDNTIMAQISTLALTPWRWVFSAILVAFGLWAAFHGPKTHFRRKLDLNGLIKVQSANFPYIKPFIKFNPAKQPPRAPGAPVPAELPLFAEALGPEEWVAYFGVPVPDGKLDKEAAQRAFAKQLGKPWRGPAHLSMHCQVLLAAFCLKAARKRNESDELLGKISESWSHDKGLRLPLSVKRQTKKILADRDLVGSTVAKCNQHAYENTAMLRALATARDEGGVLPPAMFLWLRGYDRPLWYCLNNLGRQSFHIEGLGGMAHYKAEKLTQRPILRPKVEDAVTSIADYLVSRDARPIPPLDYSKSKNKRAIKKVKGS